MFLQQLKEEQSPEYLLLTIMQNLLGYLINSKQGLYMMAWLVRSLTRLVVDVDTVLQ
jgi:hypothetical protein